MEPVIDDGNYPEIHCHSMSECYVIGPLVRFLMWDWFRLNGIWQRRIVGALTRPLIGLEEDQRRSWQEIANCRAPTINGIDANLH
jgi:hypothetical protein